MNIRLRYEGNIVLLYLEGNIDIDSANLIETTGQLAGDGSTKILCNFKNVNLIDNNGLSILAIAFKNVVNKGGILKFSNVPRHIKELFKLSRLDLVFDIYDTEEKALMAFETVTKIDKLYLRRRFKRLEFYHAVRFNLKKTPEKKIIGKILNISGSGIFIYTKEVQPVQSNIIVEIKLENDQVYEVEGIIMWHADKDIQPHCYPGMGIQFTDIKSDVQKEILDFIDKNMTSRTDY